MKFLPPGHEGTKVHQDSYYATWKACPINLKSFVC